VFLKDKLKPDEKSLIEYQALWRDCLGLIAMRQQLAVMNAYVSAARQCLGTKKPLEHRRAALVRALARTWEKLKGRWPKSGRDPHTGDQTGPFARFVRISCSVLPSEFKADRLDAIIRRTCDAGSH
jgi:hypothetical protein